MARRISLLFILIFACLKISANPMDFLHSFIGTYFFELVREFGVPDMVYPFRNSENPAEDDVVLVFEQAGVRAHLYQNRVWRIEKEFEENTEVESLFDGLVVQYLWEQDGYSYYQMASKGFPLRIALPGEKPQKVKQIILFRGDL